MGFEVRFVDERTTVVNGADAYEQEGPLTTFFARNGGAGRLASAFSVRVASFRTERLVEIRLLDYVADIEPVPVERARVEPPEFEALGATA
ncbi:MAG: hypothetical protein JWL83_1097 [Actinomycetia bacterium]|nr:hypothetical protein [Actinomycetes bacterium]